MSCTLFKSYLFQKNVFLYIFVFQKKIFLYIFVRGALDKFVAWQCVDNMLSKNTYFWKLEFKRLFGGSIYVEKGLSMHVQRMLKMTRCLLTGGKF